MTNRKFNLKVGQIIYLELASQGAILPALVEEEVTRQTVTGATKTYGVRIPNKQGLFDVTKLTMNWYPSIEEAKAQLMRNAQVGIDAVCHRAVVMAAKHFDERVPMTFAKEPLQTENETFDVEADEVETPARSAPQVQSKKATTKKSQSKKTDSKLVAPADDFSWDDLTNSGLETKLEG